MREHIELRVLRNILNAAGHRYPDVNAQFFTHYSEIETELWARVRESAPVEVVATSYLALSLLKKWKGWKSGLDLRALTYDVWLNAERHCFRTNYRLRSLDNPISDSTVDTLIRGTRRHIINMIGREPGDEWYNLCDWATGATADCRRDSLCHQRLQEKASSSANAAKHMYGIYELAYKITKSNRLEFVPKTFKVHRPIACEPTINAFLQKGVGRLIRKRLRRVGINLDTQADVNRDYCFLAASCGLSTIDLESASDTLSLSLCSLVLPHAWYSLLCDLRSEFSRYDGKNVLLEKMSSMGNGFTFELETVVFRAICLSVYDMLHLESELAVFGDDIVCDRRAYDQICQSLEFFGFIINKQKSFKDGDFFESCGRHYYRECNITPVYVKDVVKTVPQLIVLYNQLFRWAQRTGLRHIVRDSLRLIKLELSSRVRGDLPWQPSILDGDAGLCTDIQEGWYYDKNGDIILRRALVVCNVPMYLLHQEFYYQNSLRCGNAIYDGPDGLLQVNVREHWRINSNVKRWRSSIGHFDALAFAP